MKRSSSFAPLPPMRIFFVAVHESVCDPNVWSGRASQEGFVDLLALRSCINVSGL
jgi:hypothetical protein